MKFSFRKAGLVAKQEIRAVVWTKGFLLALFIPLIFLVIITSLLPLVESLMEKSKKNLTHPVRIGVIGSEADVLEAWRSKLEQRKLSNGLPMFEFNPLSIAGIPEETILASAKKKVREKKLDAIAYFEGDVTGKGFCEFYSMRGFNIELPSELKRGLRDSVQTMRLKNEGFDSDKIAALKKNVEWREYEVAAEVVVGKEGEKKRQASFERLFAPAIISVMMMFFLVFTTSQRMLRGIVEEKTSRVVEILLSSVSPTELLTGKVSGFFVIGIIQFIVWVGFGLIVALYKGFAITEYVPAAYFFQFLLFLCTGYLFYAAIFAAIGAMVGDETESQGLQGIITMFIVIPMMFNIVIITQPNWWVIRLLSYAPCFTPAIMAIRLIAAPIPLWEICAIAASSIFFSILATILAARIFRIGILLTGKRPTLRELWRWCFYRDVSGVVER